ncbi:MAG: hypothetical protein AB7F96_07620 [Beijerinckiaceae bacterium]
MLAEVLTAWMTIAGPALPPLPGDPVVYEPAARATSNWRWQAATHLDLKSESLLAFVTGLEPKRLPRCIRLNNYWCIKRAGWIGEVASDSEGHVAFSSSFEGAVVAVRLLRRYYVDYKRKSALAIVSRWAPAQCGYVSVPVSRPIARGGVRVRENPNLRKLSKRGIGNTLRARFLARHGRAGIAVRPRFTSSARPARQTRPARRSRVAASRVPYNAPVLMRAPSISPGMGEKSVAIAPMRVASLPPPPKPGAARERAIPRIGCTSEAVRIRNYAAKMSEGVAKDIKDDLKLFDADGNPGPNLKGVLARMAAVEIGPYRVDEKLIAAAIAAATASTENRQKALQQASSGP